MVLNMVGKLHRHPRVLFRVMLELNIGLYRQLNKPRRHRFLVRDNASPSQAINQVAAQCLECDACYFLDFAQDTFLLRSPKVGVGHPFQKRLNLVYRDLTRFLIECFKICLDGVNSALQGPLRRAPIPKPIRST
jgi:hypothetical protein